MTKGRHAELARLARFSRLAPLWLLAITTTGGNGRAFDAGGGSHRGPRHLRRPRLSAHCRAEEGDDYPRRCKIYPREMKRCSTSIRRYAMPAVIGLLIRDLESAPAPALCQRTVRRSPSRNSSISSRRDRQIQAPEQVEFLTSCAGKTGRSNSRARYLYADAVRKPRRAGCRPFGKCQSNAEY